jgi:hypothetical protein
MITRRTTLSLGLMVGALLALPAAQAAADTTNPVAQSAGSGAPAPDPAIVGVPITRTEKSLTSAGDFIDQGNGALAAKPLTSARTYLIRSYNGARYLIAHPPPVPAEARVVSASTYRTLARRLVRASHRGNKSRSRMITAQVSGGAVGPAFADNPTAVFDVFMSQYGAVTASTGMYPDTTGSLQSKDALVFNTALILRNRLVKAIAAAEPPAPPEARRNASAAGAPVGTTYAPVMPGLSVLIDDEIQLLQTTIDDVPAAAKPAITKAIAADTKIQTLVNATWPPAADA